MSRTSRKRLFSLEESGSDTTPLIYDNSCPRSGKWTLEEETFANRLISEFEAGFLTDCEEGTTLRSYLAKKLNCAPMRISKKFAGRCIGKVFQCFSLCSFSSLNLLLKFTAYLHKER